MRSSCGGHGIDFLCHPLAQHLTILTPEVFLGRAGGLSHSKIAPGMIEREFQPGNQSVAIPDFANIHFSKVSHLLCLKADRCFQDCYACILCIS